MALFYLSGIQSKSKSHPMRTARNTILFDVRLPSCRLFGVIGRRKRTLSFQSNTSGESMVDSAPMKSSGFPVKS